MSRFPLVWWEAVPTDDRFRVTRLFLDKNRLTGEQPPELGDLTELNLLHLDEKRLTGETPPELGEIDSLLDVDLSDNGLAGEIPAELGNAAKLGQLLLANNQLTGEIPPELGNFTNLNHLHIQPGDVLPGFMPASFRQRRASNPVGPERFAYFRYPDFLPLCKPWVRVGRRTPPTSMGRLPPA